MEYLYKDLVLGAKGGCKIAMENLIRRLHPLIYSAIRRYRKGRDVEDLYQEACILLIEAVRDFDEGRGIPFLAFAKSRIYYGIHNITRKNNYELSLDEPLWEEDGQNMLDLLEDTGPGVEDLAAKKELSNILKNAMDSLTLKQREVITAHYFEDKKFKDIAIAQDVHYKTILRLKERAIRGLRHRLEDEVILK